MDRKADIYILCSRAAWRSINKGDPAEAVLVRWAMPQITNAKPPSPISSALPLLLADLRP